MKSNGKGGFEFTVKPETIRAIARVLRADVMGEAALEADCWRRDQFLFDCVHIWAAAHGTPGRCVACGCTEGRACAGGCSWLNETRTLCSCVDDTTKVRRKHGGR